MEHFSFLVRLSSRVRFYPGALGAARRLKDEPAITEDSNI